MYVRSYIYMLIMFAAKSGCYNSRFFTVSHVHVMWSYNVKLIVFNTIVFDVLCLVSCCIS